MDELLKEINDYAAWLKLQPYGDDARLMMLQGFLIQRIFESGIYKPIGDKR